MNGNGVSVVTGLALQVVGILRATQQEVDPEGRPAEYIIAFAAAIVAAASHASGAGIDEICSAVADTAKNMSEMVEKNKAAE